MLLALIVAEVLQAASGARQAHKDFNSWKA
jgi:hypothetical protein